MGFELSGHLFTYGTTSKGRGEFVIGDFGDRNCKQSQRLGLKLIFTEKALQKHVRPVKSGRLSFELHPEFGELCISLGVIFFEFFDSSFSIFTFRNKTVALFLKFRLNQLALLREVLS